MKTALQQAIKEIAELWSSPSDQPTYTQIFNILESKLPIEKQQIIDAYEEGQRAEAKQEFWTKGNKYYTETFKTK
jgi:CHASE3 domain sensor protein